MCSLHLPTAQAIHSVLAGAFPNPPLTDTSPPSDSGFEPSVLSSLVNVAELGEKPSMICGVLGLWTLGGPWVFSSWLDDEVLLIHL